MILQALTEYYDRKMADPDPAMQLAPFGLEDKEIPFVIELAHDGQLVAIKDTRTDHGKRKIGARYRVPRAVKKTSGVAANLLWDTVGYAVGPATQAEGERGAQKVTAFRARLEALPPDARADAGVRAVLAFLDDAPTQAAAADPLWPELAATDPLITFRLVDDVDLVCQRPAVLAAIAASRGSLDGGSQATLPCLVTGSAAPPERLHAAIKGVWKAQSSGANIVSFNRDAFNSYGKAQGDNAPVSPRAAFAYTTALNHLLRRDSRQRVQVGDASTVFWAQRQNDAPFETVFAQVFGGSDDPDARTAEMRALLESVHSGRFRDPSSEHWFFVLGLAPNAARIAVRFWHAAPLGDIARRIRTWFADLELVRGPHDPEYPSLFRLLSAVAAQGKADNIPPNLGGDIMRSILAGTPFPATWLNAAISRCRAEQRVTFLRAAAIKACLNRSARHASPPSISERKITPMLDSTNPSTPYRLGRLFAALEKAQEEASPGLNATIRDRYYAAASTSPVAVFTTLLRLKNHHLAKFDNRGRAINLEKLIGEIMAGLDDFPPHLALRDQGRFALGYYHQRQAFFTKRSGAPTDGEQA